MVEQKKINAATLRKKKGEEAAAKKKGREVSQGGKDTDSVEGLGSLGPGPSRMPSTSASQDAGQEKQGALGLPLHISNMVSRCGTQK